MKRVGLFLFMLTAGAALTAGAVSAGEKGPLAPIAPYVDELTLLVIHVDVPRLKAEETFQRFAQFAGPSAGDQKAFLGMHAEFVRAGGKDLFILFNLADGPWEPLAIMSLAPGANKQAFLDLVKQGPPTTQVAEKEGVVLLGSEKAVTAARQRQPKAVPELAKAFAAVEASAVQAILLPPRPFLRAQEELAPDLPKELGGGPITVVTRGFQWGAVGVQVTPKLELKVVVQARDAGAAAELQKLAERVLAAAVAGVERDVPALAQLLGKLNPKADGDRLAVALDDQAIQSVLNPVITQTRAAASRAQSTNNLKQMALAMHSYHDVFKSLPAQASRDMEKKPLLSWRVHILPFVEGDGLYRQFKLDEPWDSAHNKKLIAQMPPVYQSPLARNLPAGKTVYLAAASPKMAFGGPNGLSILKIFDGTSNTIMLVEANDDRAVFWTQPEDYKPQRNAPAAPLVRKDAKGFHAAFADGSVKLIPNNVDADEFWGLLTIDGGELPPEWLGLPKVQPKN